MKNGSSISNIQTVILVQLRSVPTVDFAANTLQIYRRQIGNYQLSCHSLAYLNQRSHEWNEGHLGLDARIPESLSEP
jgi:hypothetical protein